MKMISSTRSTSIIGVTLMSDCTVPDVVPVPMAMLLLLLLLIVREYGHLVRLRDGGHHAHPGAAGRLDRFLHLDVLELIVRFEVQDLVFGPARKARAELVLQRAIG